MGSGHIVDRRGFCVGAAGLVIAGCGHAEPTPQPQPSQTPSPFATAVSGPLPINWRSFRTQFLRDGRIVDNGNGGISHSEGQGYAMILAAKAGDRAGFDAVWRWTEDTLARNDVALFSWRYDPRIANPVADRNNATDGDLLIGLGLGLAADRWRDARYADRSRAIGDAVATRLVRTVGERQLLLPGLEGFVTDAQTTVNPAYYVWPAIDRYARSSPVWKRIAADGTALIAAARFGPRQLPTDWFDVSPAGVLSPAAGRPPRFGFDAVRVPLYAAVAGRNALADPARAWWSSQPPQAIPAWVDVLTGEQAPYALSPGGMAVANRILGRPRSTVLDKDYYSAVLQCLVATL